MEDFIYLSFEDVLGYYRETIEQSGGGMSGIRVQAEIEKVLDFVQNDLYYPSLEDKLTYMVFAFCTGHYFADGNKRITGDRCPFPYQEQKRMGGVPFLAIYGSIYLACSSWKYR